MSVPSVSFITGADVGAVSVGTIRSHVTSMASIEYVLGRLLKVSTKALRERGRGHLFVGWALCRLVERGAS